MGNDNEELIDYEDEHDIVPNGGSVPSAGHGATSGDAESDKDKKNFSGIHSTGFRYTYKLLTSLHLLTKWMVFSSRDFLLKPELRRAISDLGFEHPSEGMFHIPW